MSEFDNMEALLNCVRARGLPNGCCVPDRALCCLEKGREVPHANSKGILRKRGSKEVDNVLSLSSWKMQDTGARHILL